MNKSTGHWLQGHVDGARSYIQNHLLPLLELHCVPDVQIKIRSAIYDLNAVHGIIERQIEAEAAPNGGK